jgi:hypothetical protein
MNRVSGDCISDYGPLLMSPHCKTPVIVVSKVPCFSGLDSRLFCRGAGPYRYGQIPATPVRERKHPALNHLTGPTLND